MCDLSTSLNLKSKARFGWHCIGSASRTPKTSICKWDGVICNGELVTEISLSFTSTSGSIPSSIGGLVSLTRLHLINLSLIGTLPWTIGLLSRLKEVSLQNNLISGSIPWTIGRLTNIEIMNIQNNHLSGIIPSSITDLIYLKTLHLDNNKLSGTIPPLIGIHNIINILILILFIFDSFLPHTVGSLSSLEALILDHNSLSGSIPSRISALTLLQYISLSNNLLYGSIPLEIYTLCQLQHLDLAHNRLSGTIPSTFAKLSSLRTLQLNDNRIHGVLPSALCTLTALSTLSVYSTLLTCYASCLSTAHTASYGSLYPCTANPSAKPTYTPTTYLPTWKPSSEPTIHPSHARFTVNPSPYPTVGSSPTPNPIIVPTYFPSSSLTQNPSVPPTFIPSPASLPSGTPFITPLTPQSLTVAPSVSVTSSSLAPSSKQTTSLTPTTTKSMTSYPSLSPLLSTTFIPTIQYVTASPTNGIFRHIVRLYTFVNESLADSSPNTRGTLTGLDAPNGLSFVAGVDGTPNSAVYLNGNQQYIRTSTVGIPMETSSVLIWLKLDNTVGESVASMDNTHYNSNNNNNNIRFRKRTINSNYVILSLESNVCSSFALILNHVEGGGVVLEIASQCTPLTVSLPLSTYKISDFVGQWNHFAVTTSETTGTAIYVNSNLVAHVSQGHSQTNVSENQWLAIGVITTTLGTATSAHGVSVPSGNDSLPSFRGSIDSIMIYDVALSEAMISRIYDKHDINSSPLSRPTSFPSTKPTSLVTPKGLHSYYSILFCIVIILLLFGSSAITYKVCFQVHYLVIKSVVLFTFYLECELSVCITEVLL